MQAQQTPTMRARRSWRSHTCDSRRGMSPLYPISRELILGWTLSFPLAGNCSIPRRRRLMKGQVRLNHQERARSQKLSERGSVLWCCCPKGVCISCLILVTRRGSESGFVDTCLLARYYIRASLSPEMWVREGNFLWSIKEGIFVIVAVFYCFHRLLLFLCSFGCPRALLRKSKEWSHVQGLIPLKLLKGNTQLHFASGV